MANTLPPSVDGRSPEALKSGVFAATDLSPVQVQQICRQLKERRRLNSSLLTSKSGSSHPYGHQR